MRTIRTTVLAVAAALALALGGAAFAVAAGHGTRHHGAAVSLGAAMCTRPWDWNVQTAGGGSGAWSQVDWEAPQECGWSTIQDRSLCLNRFSVSKWFYSGLVNGSEIEDRASCDGNYPSIVQAQARGKHNGVWDNWATYWHN